MEPLKDPLGDRPVPSVKPPPALPLDRKLLLPNETANSVGKPDYKVLLEHLRDEGRLNIEDILDVVRTTTTMLRQEPNVLKLKDPLVIVGDIHGQYYDLLKMLDVGGKPGETQYVFLGDYVDRGSFSTEVVMLMYCLKLNYPQTTWLLRGNHECRQMTEFFNFQAECEHKYNMAVYDAMMESFDALPIACVVNGKFLALHGGISPEMRTLDTLSGFDRFIEPPRQGLFCDILWADPAVDKKPPNPGDLFYPNDVRGCSYFFTFDGIRDFLKRTVMLSVIRAHEAQIEGYKMHRENAKTGFPSVITVFSAPNYCDVYNNKAAVLKFSNNTLNILQYHSSKHPYHLPNFMSLFAWSVPFVSERVTEMLYHLMNSGLEEMENDEEEDKELPPLVHQVCRKSLSADQNKAVELAARLAAAQQEQTRAAGGAPAGGSTLKRERIERLRQKVRTVARMQRMFKAVRQNHEGIVRLNGLCPGDRLNPNQVGQALGGENGFEQMVQLDSANEAMPENAPKAGA